MQDPSIIDVHTVERIPTADQHAYDYIGLGDEYKAGLKLNDQQVAILNKLWYPSNNFNSIPFCRAEIVKLFLLVLDDLAYRYKKQGSTIEVQFNVIADTITRKNLANGINDYNYKYSVLSILNDIHNHVFKHVENALRNHYGHARKINTDIDYRDEEINTLFHEKLSSKLSQVLPIWVPRVMQPDEFSDIALYTQSTNRWKIKFEELNHHFGQQAEQYFKGILELARRNRNNPQVELIYYEACKSIVGTDQQTGLKLYLHYIHADLLSVTFDNRPLNKTIQKKLFKTNEQLETFHEIVQALVVDQDLKKAISAIPTIFGKKRKKIQIDLSAIDTINQKHSGTVELLNKYLQDDVEEEVLVEAVILPIVLPVQNTQPVLTSIFLADLVFSQIQLEMILHFSRNNFTVAQEEFEQMAKARGAFKNQLVDSINEICYDTIDDVLIEEEEENYIINESYYQSILAT